MSPRRSANPEPPFEWDWWAVVLILFAIFIVLVLTFEAWIPHFGGPE